MGTSKTMLGAVALAMLLSGCVTLPDDAEAAAADYGATIYSPDCERIVRQYIDERLRDPTTARYSFDHPCYRGYLPGSTMDGIPVTYGYVQTGTVNATNAFGGYTGRTPFCAVVRDGRLHRIAWIGTEHRYLSRSGRWGYLPQGSSCRGFPAP